MSEDQPTGADLQGTALAVHGKVLEVHDAVSSDGETLAVENTTVGK